MTAFSCDEDLQQIKTHLNDLSAKVYQVLSGLNTFSEYELLSEFGEHPALVAHDRNDSLGLFQKHFVMMHVLYSLRSLLLAAGEGTLEISPTKISLRKTQLKQDTTELSVDFDDTKLDEYYSDFTNIFKEDEASVDNMLAGFWKRYAEDQAYRRMDVNASMTLFQLNDDFTMQDLRKRFRVLAQKLHPDKGGDAEAFNELQDAYACLVALCRRHK